jgi:NTP pyrophosphatase (non-canonical NTP hydrolase)
VDVNEMMVDVRKQIASSPVLCRLRGNEVLQHAVCGLAEEAGEVSGLLKRVIYRDINVPIDRWVEELGDTLWYWLATVDALGLDPQQVFELNKEKLEARYGAIK